MRKWEQVYSIGTMKIINKKSLNKIFVRNLREKPVVKTAFTYKQKAFSHILLKQSLKGSWEVSRSNHSITEGLEDISNYLKVEWRGEKRKKKERGLEGKTNLFARNLKILAKK